MDCSSPSKYFKLQTGDILESEDKIQGSQLRKEEALEAGANHVGLGMIRVCCLLD